jgi:hypothetical protein
MRFPSFYNIMPVIAAPRQLLESFSNKIKPPALAIEGAGGVFRDGFYRYIYLVSH